MRQAEEVGPEGRERGEGPVARRDVLGLLQGDEAMKSVKNLTELREEFDAIQSVACDTDRWICKAFMLLIENGFDMRPPPRKKAATANNQYIGAGMKAGKTPVQIAREWKAR
jgi:hypothetical protein